MSIDLWLALLCAFLFAVGALIVKRANQLGAGPWQATLVSNVATAIGFLFLLPLGGTVLPLSQWWQPAIVAVSFIIGQACVYAAYHRGDVSVATPILGVKIVLVAVFTTVLIGERLSWRIWLGAVLSTLAVVLLNRTERSAGGRAGFTAAMAIGCAAFFALFDVLVQKWGPAWGAGRFLPIMMLMVAAMSIVLHPFFAGMSAPLSWPVARRLWLGNGIIALQSTIFVAVLLIHQSAASMNVVFSSRGLWTVALVWMIGHWFGSSEREAGAAVFRWRLAGAILMMAAIVLVVMR